MFTGLVESVGVVSAITRTAEGVELRIDTDFTDLARGESISVNGVCLTVLQSGEGWFTVAAMTETISRTAIGEWKAGRRVNLERALRADGRLGGHIVQGHVDGVGSVDALTRTEDAMLIDVAILPVIAETLVLHGSVAIDGVSLTVNRLEGDKLQVALIEHTSRNTTLGELSVGAKVHVETDIVGKYVRKLVAPYLKQ